MNHASQNEHSRKQRLRRSFWATPSEKAAQSTALKIAARPLEYCANQTKVIIAHNEFHSGRAVFTRTSGVWTCTASTPNLRFLMSLDPISAKMDLIRRGFSWQWEEKSDKPAVPA